MKQQVDITRTNCGQNERSSWPVAEFTHAFVHKHERLIDVMPLVMIVVGTLLCFAPLVTNWYAQWQAKEHVSSMSTQAQGMDPIIIQTLLAQARAYNAQIGFYEDAGQDRL